MPESLATDSVQAWCTRLDTGSCNLQRLAPGTIQVQGAYGFGWHQREIEVIAMWTRTIAIEGKFFRVGSEKASRTRGQVYLWPRKLANVEDPTGGQEDGLVLSQRVQIPNI